MGQCLHLMNMDVAHGKRGLRDSINMELGKIGTPFIGFKGGFRGSLANIVEEGPLIQRGLITNEMTTNFTNIT